MGEAKLKKSRLHRILQVQPFCIYCGGATLGETVDHMPPVTMFDRRQRPQGLEFVACLPCNKGSALTDQVVGYFSRVYPDPRSEAAKDEAQKIIAAIANNHPGLLEEMLPSVRQKHVYRRHRQALPHDAGGVLNAGGPLVNAQMQRFGAKLGLAMHFEETGRIVPSAGAIAVRWYSNFDRITESIPDDLVTLLGRARTLKQGRFSVGNQFAVASVSTEDRLSSVHFATFRLSFAVASLVSEDASVVAEAPSTHLHRPGCLKQQR